MPQQPVADRVAQAVVDRLESVQVEIAQTYPALRVGRLQRGVQAGPELVAVGQPGQRVADGLAVEVLLEHVPVGDVLEQQHLVVRFAAGVADQRCGQLAPGVRAVRLGAADLQPATVGGPGQIGQGVPEFRRPVLVDQFEHGPADQVVRRTLEDPAHRRVDLLDSAVQRHDRDAQRRGVEHHAGPRLAGPQRLLGGVPRVQHGLLDHFLLGQGLLAQPPGEPRGQVAEHAEQAVGPQPGQESGQLGAEQPQRAGEHLGVGEVDLDELGAYLQRRTRQRGAGQLADQPVHAVVQVLVNVGARQRHIAGVHDRTLPASDEFKTVHSGDHDPAPSGARCGNRRISHLSFASVVA